MRQVSLAELRETYLDAGGSLEAFDQFRVERMGYVVRGTGIRPKRSIVCRAYRDTRTPYGPPVPPVPHVASPPHVNQHCCQMCDEECQAKFDLDSWEAIEDWEVLADE